MTSSTQRIVMRLYFTPGKYAYDHGWKLSQKDGDEMLALGMYGPQKRGPEAAMTSRMREARFIQDICLL